MLRAATSQKFDYKEFTTRNLGFVTEEEQEILRQARVFIPGVGGMGGTALALLARSGIENFIIADIESFELSNLNRQIFSGLSTINQEKAKTARDAILNINPEIKVKVLGAEWNQHLSEILPNIDIVINGCDDIKSTIQLMRQAAEYGKTVIDAYASSLPSVYVVRPQDPRPEKALGFPTLGLAIDSITPEVERQCAALEMEHVLVHSQTANHVHLQYASEMIAGKRKRISFAPMVWATGVLMSYEAVKLILKKPTHAGSRGVFLNPWTFQFEKPLPGLVAFFKRILVRNFLRRIGRAS